MPSKLPLSEERVVDSSDSDSDTADSAPRITQKKPEQKKKLSKQNLSKATSKSSSSTSKTTSKSSDNLNLDDDKLSDGDASSSSSNSSKSDARLPQKRSTDSTQSTEPARKKQKANQIDKVTRIEPRPYFPPSGFTKIPQNPSDYSSGIGHIFDDLDGKQVWHITVPASVDLSELKECDLNDMLSGKPLLEQDGTSYGLQPSSETAEVLLLPGGADNQYRQLNGSIKRSFQLREVTSRKQVTTQSHAENASDGDHGSSPRARANSPPPVFFATETGQNAPPRTQPQGLRARWTPYGAPPPPSNLPTTNGQDIEMTNGISLPPAVDNADDATGIQSVVETPRKRGKKQKNVVQVETVPGTDVMDVIQEAPGREKVGASQQRQVNSEVGSLQAIDTPSQGEGKRKKKKKEKAIVAEE